MRKKKLTEWIDEQPSYGLCNPPMTPDEALEFLCAYLIPGEYDPLPEGAHQTNTFLVDRILHKYSRAYRKEVRDWLKKKRNKDS